MSFSVKEVSAESGAPTEIYEIVEGPNIYRLVDDIVDWEFDGETYYATSGIRRSKININKEDNNEVFTVEVDASHEFVQNYILNVPGTKATLSIYRFHRTDTPSYERVLFWKGLVQSVAFEKQGNLGKIALKSLTSVLGRQLPRYSYQGLCNFTLYDTQCTVDINSFIYYGNGASVSGNTVTVTGLSAAKGSSWATGGYLTNPSNQDYRMILSQTGDICELIFPFRDDFDIVGASLKVVAGCDHSIPTCKTKFNNVINYGGFAYVPKKNVFNSGI